MRLDSPRVIGVVASGLVLAGWLLGSTLSPPVANTQEREATRRPPRPVEASPITPLQLLTRAAPRPPAPTRNPFVFGRDVARGSSTPSLAPPESAIADADTDTTTTPASTVAADDWRLVGVAVGADGVVTAVISGAGDVHLVRAGDQLPDATTVAEVTSELVRLERADGTRVERRLP
jgi:hypothetical protein